MNGSSFKKAAWIVSTNVYEVNIRHYTTAGSFNAFSLELPRLKDMGIETLWFMPVTPIAQKNKKGASGSPYACSDYTAINPEFGTAEDFKELVNRAHEMGFKVIIDWVANHTGWDHEWTTRHPDYYLTDPATGDFKIASGMDDIIELNYNNPALRKDMIHAMSYWIAAFDIDGFRCDLAFWVDLGFWKEARSALESLKVLFWLGEFDPLENPAYFEAFDAAYTWTWMHKTENYCKGEIGIESLTTILQQYNEFCNAGNILLWFTANHDENSWNGTEYEKFGHMAISLAVFKFTWNGMPLIYSGQELPNAKRLEFFEKDTIAWTGRHELHEFYKTLTSLKRNNQALWTGDNPGTTDLLNFQPENSCLGYIRKRDDHELLVLMNWSNEKCIYRVDEKLNRRKFRNVFEGVDTIFKTGCNIELEPWGFKVFEKRE